MPNSILTMRDAPGPLLSSAKPSTGHFSTQIAWSWEFLMPIRRILAISAITTPAAARSSAGSPAPHFIAQNPAIVVLKEQNMKALDIFYPDNPVGVVSTGNGKIFVFSSCLSFGRFGPGENLHRLEPINLLEPLLTSDRPEPPG